MFQQSDYTCYEDNEKLLLFASTLILIALSGIVILSFSLSKFKIFKVYIRIKLI